jgi:LacI family transcriptional regulator
MPKRFRVALLIESSRAYGRQLLRGIASFARERGDWVYFHEERSLGDDAPARLKLWRPDGVIARLAGDNLIDQIRRLRIPAVDLYHEEELPGIPGVAVDQDALAEMAVAHFIERGFQNFAYCGFAGVLFSDLRESQFVKRLVGQGRPVHVFRYPPLLALSGLAAVEAHALQYTASLVHWLAELPKPVALLACNDMRGRQVLAACDEAKIAVPDEVAVLGVDNDDVQCELSNPPLSSIDPNAWESGYQSAQLLQLLLDRQKVPDRRHLVSPSRIAVRRSTDILAIADRKVADAVGFVRLHACNGFDGDVMASRLGVSRSTLERWFRRILNHSLTDEIVRVQVNRVAELLLTTNLTLEKIAGRTGFDHVETMSRIFKRRQGLSPGQYRIKQQPHARRTLCDMPSPASLPSSS